MSWPKLSELPGPRQPDRCQNCGTQPPHLRTWVEHNDNDQPTDVIVLLCDPCSKKIIEPHPRLYGHDRSINKPRPGAIFHLCLECRFREGLDCKHPDLKANGGSGLMISVGQPARGFWDGAGPHGRRTGGQFEVWPLAKDCKGRQQI